MKTKLLPLFLLAALPAAALAATPPNTLVVVQSLDDIVSLDPAEANELSSIQTVPSLYQRLDCPNAERFDLEHALMLSEDPIQRLRLTERLGHLPPNSVMH